MNHDLFGRALEPDSPALTPAERRRLLGPPKRKPTQPRGHAAPPGSGPEGQTCGSCCHLYRNRLAKTYLKCALVQAYWTGGLGSDVRAKDAACSRWEALQP